MPLCDPYSELTEIDTIALEYLEAGTQPSTMRDAMEKHADTTSHHTLTGITIIRVTEIHL
jgi:hypothetical protein